MKFVEFLIGVGIMILLIVGITIYSKWEAKKATRGKGKFKHDNI